MSNIKDTFESSDHRLITEERARDIYRRIQEFQEGDGRIGLSLRAWWRGGIEWARNRSNMASDRKDIQVIVFRSDEQGKGEVVFNQVDDTSLIAAVRAAERLMRTVGGSRANQAYRGLEFIPPKLPFPDTEVWSESTYRLTYEEKSTLARHLTEEAEAEGLLSAGLLEMRIGEEMSFGLRTGLDGRLPVSSGDIDAAGTGGQRTARDMGYVVHTEARCSMTVRHPKGIGSGWAGLSGYDWSVFNANRLAERALDKCLQSLNPVRIEPGRYTVVLEPQATCFIVEDLVGVLQDRPRSESKRDRTPFTLGYDQSLDLVRSKLGLKVIDERISISHDPMDAQQGIVPSLGLVPTTWIENGVLKEMGYNRDNKIEDYSLGILNENLPTKSRGSFHLSGGETSIDEMIASTERGILVSRFSNKVPVEYLSMLSTFTTRDGLWLIENGRISKAINNMRATESPLFVLNQVVQLGQPVPVFRPGSEDLRPAIVPPLKANDFAFTSLIDAI